MAMRSLGHMPSEMELAIIMQRLDMDGEGRQSLLFQLLCFAFAFCAGDGQVDFEEFMTILGPKVASSDNREAFLGNAIDNIFWQVSGMKTSSSILSSPPSLCTLHIFQPARFLERAHKRAQPAARVGQGQRKWVDPAFVRVSCRSLTCSSRLWTSSSDFCFTPSAGT